MVDQTSTCAAQGVGEKDGYPKVFIQLLLPQSRDRLVQVLAALQQPPSGTSLPLKVVSDCRGRPLLAL
jgi:hypothetical protein